MTARWNILKSVPFSERWARSWDSPTACTKLCMALHIAMHKYTLNYVETAIFHITHLGILDAFSNEQMTDLLPESYCIASRVSKSQRSSASPFFGCSVFDWSISTDSPLQIIAALEDQQEMVHSGAQRCCASSTCGFGISDVNFSPKEDRLDMQSSEVLGQKQRGTEHAEVSNVLTPDDGP